MNSAVGSDLPDLFESGLSEGAAAVCQAVDAAFADMREGRVSPIQSVDAIQSLIDAIDPDAAAGLIPAIEEASELMRGGDLLSAHARCFGFFNPTPTLPGILADFLSAARNPQLCVVSHAPASVLIERRLIAWLRARLGYPHTATGHFTSGGSEANATGLQVALARLCPDFGRDGAAALGGRPRLYASSDSHLAWIKLARSAGLGSDAVRLVPTDGSGRMSVEALQEQILADRKAGDIAVMIAATAGTTSAGMVDPLHACADLAEDLGTHLHVDAAWAGGLIVDPVRKSQFLGGIERADSVTIDAHKWLSVPMGAGIAFVRDADALARAFSVSTSYMPAGDGADAYITSYQWSRRAIGLRLWLTLRAIGSDGYRRMFDRQFALAATLRARLPEAGYTVRNRSELPVVVFDESEGRDSAELAAWLEADGQVWLGHVRFEGRSVLRACITSYLTSEADIDILLDRLKAARANVQRPR